MRAREPFEKLQAAGIAVRHLRAARDALKLADAPKALAKVRLALRSAEGAVRHASNGFARLERQQAKRARNANA